VPRTGAPGDASGARAWPRRRLRAPLPRRGAVGRRAAGDRAAVDAEPGQICAVRFAPCSAQPTCGRRSGWQLVAVRALLWQCGRPAAANQLGCCISSAASGSTARAARAALCTCLQAKQQAAGPALAAAAAPELFSTESLPALQGLSGGRARCNTCGVAVWPAGGRQPGRRHTPRLCGRVRVRSVVSGHCRRGLHTMTCLASSPAVAPASSSA
jgi:hypothetical protein